jgi:hypothetical protein
MRAATSHTDSMERPTKIDLPFFSYGIFRPGQLGFLQLKELVKERIAPRRWPF